MGLLNWANSIRISYEKCFNEKRYWKIRNYIQTHQMGGVRSYLYLTYLRRYESKRCSQTGLALGGECAAIKGAIRFPHGLNCIIIARNVVIGEGVSIYQGVTIAEEDKNKKTIIGNNVLLYPNAIILNNSSIGDNSKVGAGAVVTHDVPANVIVAGNPARVIKELS